jgi:hypothetical protein
MGSRTVWLVAATLGCAVGWQPNPSMHYHLKIDPSFSTEEAQAITDAATEWQMRSGAYVSFDGDPRAPTDLISFERGTWFDMSRNFDGSLGESIFEGQSTRIILYEGLDMTTFHQTVVHEIGHAIGLVHTGPGTIMCKDTACATYEVTCADLAQLERSAPTCTP